MTEFSILFSVFFLRQSDFVRQALEHRPSHVLAEYEDFHGAAKDAGQHQRLERKPSPESCPIERPAWRSNDGSTRPTADVLSVETSSIEHLGQPESQQEVRLVEPAEGQQTRGFGGVRDRAEVDVRGDVVFTWVLQRRDAIAAPMSPKRAQGAVAVRLGIELCRVVAVIEQDQETTS